MTIPTGFGRMTFAVHNQSDHFSWWDSGGAGCFFFFPSSAHFSFMQQDWLACRSVWQLSPLIRCLAGSDRAGADGMGVLAGSRLWQEAYVDECGGRTLYDLCGIWDTGWIPREMVSAKERKGWVQGKQPREKKLKQIRRKASFYFHYCYNVSSWISVMLTQ